MESKVFSDNWRGFLSSGVTIEHEVAMAVGVFNGLSLGVRQGGAHECDSVKAQFGQVDAVEEALDDEKRFGGIRGDVLDVEQVVVFAKVFGEEVFGHGVID